MDPLPDAVKNKRRPPPPPPRGKRGLTWPWDLPESHFHLFFPSHLPGTRSTSGQTSRSKVTWLFNWELWAPAGLPQTIEWVPCVRTAGQVQDITPFLTDIQSKGRPVKHLLGFNEPEISSQANLSANEAVRLWQKYLLPAKSQLVLRLGSPGMCSDTSLCVPWLDKFFTSFLQAREERDDSSLGRGVTASGVDFLVLHWYGIAAAEMFVFLETMHDRYRLPIWLDEFACSRMGGTESTETEVSNFLKEAVPWLEATPWIERYSYFGNAQKQDVGNWVGTRSNFTERQQKAVDTGGVVLSSVGSLYLQL